MRQARSTVNLTHPGDRRGADRDLSTWNETAHMTDCVVTDVGGRNDERVWPDQVEAGRLE